MARARAAVRELLGAASPTEIRFGYNMTTLTFHISRAIAATFQPGDEILVSGLDHEANVSPWRAIAEDRGLVVRTIDVRTDDCTLDLDDFEVKLSDRTRLVAVGYASNAVGTINPIPRIIERAHAAGALTYVDAVHYVPHGPVDVQALGTDFLVTSAYKWFGPHLGVLYGRGDMFERLPSYKVRPAHDRIETGTPSFESIAGTLAAVDYLRSIGQRFGDEQTDKGAPNTTEDAQREASDGASDDTSDGTSEGRRQIVAGMGAIVAHERTLALRLLDGLAAVPGLRVWGIADRNRVAERTPTVAVTLERWTPRALAEALATDGIYAWDGDFYAQALIERLGLFGTGGVVRLGLVHYNTVDEVDRVVAVLDRLAR